MAFVDLNPEKLLGGLSDLLKFVPPYMPTTTGNHPGIPLQFEGLDKAAERLAKRRGEMSQALAGLTEQYTIGGQTKPADAFLFGTSPDRFIDGLAQLRKSLKKPGLQAFSVLMSPVDEFVMEPETSGITRLSLEQASQWSISLTKFEGALENAKPSFPVWEKTLTDAEAASQAFWPMIAENGLAYNLVLLKKINGTSLTGTRKLFSEWLPAWDGLVAAGALYTIDLSIFNKFPSASVDGHLRFTPGTVTLLQQDPTTKSLTPIAVQVSGFNSGSQIFVRNSCNDKAWLYALQAAKTSVTVYGIWLGHVYHWHIVTAAMQKALARNLKATHPVSQLVEPQSRHLIEFDLLLILLWKFIAPPTSFNTPGKFFKLIDEFANKRNFFDDDPPQTLKRLGLKEQDFTVDKPWDKYPIISFYLELWNATTAYVGSVVDASYANDAAVAQDGALKKWMAEASAPGLGNIRGLPSLLNKTNLKEVLTSLTYRVSMHGCSRLRKSLSPALSYVANYPVCLQRETIPSPQDAPTLQQLLQYMPKTGTIGLMVKFYDIFIYTKPYESMIPAAGTSANLFFPGGATDPRNKALVQFREAIKGLMARYQPDRQQPQQWPQSIET